MSYILKALKKSQQQRDRGQIPTLGRTPDPMPAPRRRPWFWWAGGALALNGVGLVAFIWWPGGPLSPGETAAWKVTASATPAPVSLQVAAGEPKVVTTPQIMSPPSLQEPSASVRLPSITPQVTTPQVATPQVATRQLDHQPAAVAEAKSSMASTISPAPVVDSGGQEVAPIPPVAPRAEIEALPTAVLQTETKEPDPASAPTVTSALAPALLQPTAALPDLAPPIAVLPAVVVPPQEPTLELEPDPYASLPLRRRLSYQIQTALPELPIVVHVYGEDAHKRFVVMKHKKYREGELVGNDLILEAITPSGAVFRFRDTSFRIEL